MGKHLAMLSAMGPIGPIGPIGLIPEVTETYVATQLGSGRSSGISMG